MQATNTTAAPLPRYADWLTPAAVAAQCGTSAFVVTKWIIGGIKTEAGRIRLRASKVGGLWKIDPVAVNEFVAATTAAALPASATAPAGAPVPSKPPTEAGLKRRGAECMARMKARGW